MNSTGDFYLVFGPPGPQRHKQVYQVDSACFLSQADGC